MEVSRRHSILTEIAELAQDNVDFNFDNVYKMALADDEGEVRSAALADPNVQKFIGAAPVRKVIIVPGKLVNIVV